MNLEMPMAALSTSAQFNTCHTYPSRSQREKYTDTYTHTGSLWCVCVSVCEHLFRIRHLASFGRADFTNEAPWTVICLDADQYPSRQADQKQRKVRTLNFQSNMHPCCLLYPHTKSQHATIWISVCSSHIPESYFFFSPCFRLELKFAAR